MIYEFPNIDEPIRQGDIFTCLPRIELSLKQVIIVKETGHSVANWSDIPQEDMPIDIIVPVRSVSAIVATQDCDAMRARDITLCEIRRFIDVEKKANTNTSIKGWKNILTQHARINIKWFYLPPDNGIGFTEKMAVDFMTTLRVPRAELEELKNQRKGRLNSVSDEHFRERIGEFFRRYPYDEWYPLDKEELEFYKSDYPQTEPYPWQKF